MPECEVELFEDDEHGGEVRWWRRYAEDGDFITTVALCDHHHDGQEEMGVELRPSHLTSKWLADRARKAEQSGLPPMMRAERDRDGRPLPPRKT